MTAYELMVKANHYLISGGKLTDTHKENILRTLLATRSDENTVQRFKKGVRAPEYLYQGQSGDKRVMYPLFYIPPYNDGKKLKTIFTQTPKTHILSANAYELEILRLLHILSVELGEMTISSHEINKMISSTLDRLRTTCFGNSDDGTGECFDSSIIVLRFLGAVAPYETRWIQDRIDSFHHRYNEKKRPWFPLWYYWLCLSEIPFGIAEPEINRYKNEIICQLNRSYVMNSKQDKMIHPVLLCMMRNALSRLPEYGYIKERLPYVSNKDGRLYFDMSKTQ